MMIIHDNKELKQYSLDWNAAVRLHKIQIGLIGRIIEYFIGSSEFWDSLEYTLYNKYGLNPYEVDRFYKLEL